MGSLSRNVMPDKRSEVKVVHQSRLNWMAAFQESLLNGVYVNIFVENLFKGEQTFICNHSFGVIVNQESEMCVSAPPHTPEL